MALTREDEAMTLVTHDDPKGLFSLSVPAGWEPAEAIDGVELMVAEPDDVEGLRSSLVVTVDEIPDLSFGDWQFGSDQLMSGQLADYVLIDLNRATDGDREALVRIAHHTVAGRYAATVVQRAILVKPFGFTVTVTIPTLRYAALVDELTAILESFTVPTSFEGAWG